MKQCFWPVEDEGVTVEGVKQIAGQIGPLVLWFVGMKSSPNKPQEAPGIGRLELVVVEEAEALEKCQEQLEQEHDLGRATAVGDWLCQKVMEAGREVGLLWWAAAAWHLKDRDAWIGWDPRTRAKRLKLVVNNQRFLLLEAARRPNLASAVLGAAVRALPDQWQRRFGYRPLLCETFTDPESHAGTCYKAAGWLPVGLSGGHRRHRLEFYLPNGRPKRLWLKPLCADAKERLCAADLAPEQAAAATDGAGERCALPAKELRSLWELFRQLPDPRAKASMRYPLPGVLSIVALAILGGAKSISDIARTGNLLTQRQREIIGLRPRKNSRVRLAPGYDVYRDLLIALEPEAFAALLNDWMGAHNGLLPRSLAMDGKSLRQKMGVIVTLAEHHRGAPAAVGAAPGAGAEAAAAAALLRDPAVELAGVTLTADALHCNAANAHTIVTRGGDYLLSVKDNQPTLAARARQCLDPLPPFTPKPRPAPDGSSSAGCASVRSSRPRSTSPSPGDS